MKRFAALSLALLILLLPACRGDDGMVLSGNFAMGSYLSVETYAGEKGEKLGFEIIRDIRALDDEISATQNGSALSKLIAKGSGKPGEPLFSLLERAVRLGEESGGALDVSLGAVTALWGFSTETPQKPGDDAVAEAMKSAGLGNITFDGDNVTLLNGVRPELGAVGKGAALDAAAKRLNGKDVPAVVTFGGSVLLYGEKPDGGGWTVGVRDPAGETSDAYFATLAFASEKDKAVFISTSGSYEKTFTEDGKTYHHILDPKTGYPVENGLVSVTAVAEDGFLSDALSTALFVMGKTDDALGLCKKYLLGAVFVYADGTVFVTERLRDAFTLKSEAYRTESPS
ncbi:MAG: FAD:protein FMN transferase [Clostridia bacterium]|nr:FAD:protein FMN transferase [Clostridia bacterium]